MKLQYHGYEPTGVAAPIVDLHDRWLVGPRLVPPDDPDAVVVLQPGQIWTLNEKSALDRHFIEWGKAHTDFKKALDRSHPDAEMWRGR